MAADDHVRIALTRVGLLVAATALAVALVLPRATAAARPMLLLYETARGEGADKELAESTTKALRNYMREVQKVEVAIFNQESPTVLRAIMDRKLTAEKIATYASQSERLDVAGELGFDYAAGAEVSVKEVEVEARASGAVSVKPVGGEEEAKPDEKASEQPLAKQRMSVLEVKLWVGRTGAGKANRWEAIGSASAAGAGVRDLDNAMQSSASFAVNDIARRAFADLPRVADRSPETGSESTAIRAEQPNNTPQPTAGDHAARAEESLKSGNIALAITEYSQAVSADPGNGALRVRLAEAYVAKGMYSEAEDELKRAKAAGATSEQLATADKLLQEAKSRQEPNTQPRAEPEAVEPAQPTSADRPINGASPPAIAKMVEGDKLWGEGKPDEAAAAYAQAAKLDPSDWRAHERLAVVNASMSLFGESRKALEALAKVQPKPSPRILAARYEMLRKSFDTHFLSLLKQYENDGADFEKHIISRESYYNTVKGLTVRLEAMAAFLDTLSVPSAKQPAHLRRSLACGLAAQAASSLLDYLETNNEKARANAQVFASQARSEMDAAAKLDENKVVVTQ